MERPTISFQNQSHWQGTTSYITKNNEPKQCLVCVTIARHMDNFGWRSMHAVDMWEAGLERVLLFCT